MKRIFALLLALGFSAAIVGCHADAGVDTNDNGNSSYKKTTTVQPNGDKTVHVEKQTND